MAAAQDATSTSVFHTTFSYLSKQYPAFDSKDLLPQLVSVGVICLNESENVKAEKTPIDRGLCLFLKILPPKALGKIKKSFDVLRCHFENETHFLDGQQNILEQRLLKQMGETLADASADLVERLENQIEVEGKSRVPNETLNDLMGKLGDLKNGQMRLAESVEKLTNDITLVVNDLSIHQALPGGEASSLEPKVPAAPSPLVNNNLEGFIWGALDIRKQFRDTYKEFRKAKIKTKNGESSLIDPSNDRIKSTKDFLT